MSELASETIDALLRFQNAVLEGPPGTGKTHAVGAVVHRWREVTGRKLSAVDSDFFAMTFHPSTAYEDFVEGLRYDDVAESFKRKDGFFLKAVDHARKHPEADVLILI